MREEAYTADKLEQQLSEQTVRFLTDTTRNRFNEDSMELSAIFKWYGDDFTLGFRGSNSLSAFILLYHQALNLTSAQQALLSSDDMDKKFLNYDWALNAVK